MESVIYNTILYLNQEHMLINKKFDNDAFRYFDLFSIKHKHSS